MKLLGLEFFFVGSWFFSFLGWDVIDIKHTLSGVQHNELILVARLLTFVSACLKTFF